jgi:hypothetical protein
VLILLVALMAVVQAMVVDSIVQGPVKVRLVMQYHNFSRGLETLNILELSAM